MERITAYRTSDGEIFTEKRDALRHLDNRMGAIITRHAGKLAQIDKYSAAIEYLEAALPELAEAHRWQAELAEAQS